MRVRGGRRWLSAWVTALVVASSVLVVVSPVLGLTPPTSARADGDLLSAGGDGADRAPSSVGANDDAERCNVDSPVSLTQTADDLLIDRYHLGQHPAVTLAHVLTWAEDPLADRQWRQKFQQLRYVMALMYRWQASGEARYLDRGIDLVRAWIAANPRVGAASDSAWKDQVTAWRAMTLVCMADMLPPTGWLDSAIRLHGSVLADPAFYVRYGNHALNQAIGLLDVGCYLHRTDWQTLAARRIDTLVTQAIDRQGVSDEQATKYDRYDYDRFILARDHLLRCHLAPPAGFDRVERIPHFLAQATRPDGHYETIGDSDDKAAKGIPGTPTVYTSSLGLRGSPPDQTVTFYENGYAFGRTGWGQDERTFAQEIFFSLRYAAGLIRHGHDDAGAVTLYGNGAQLLVDPGYGDQNSSIWHRFFVSRAAHNAVSVLGRAPSAGRGSVLERHAITSGSVDAVVRVRVYPGITMRRRVIFSRALGYLVVEDTMTSPTARTYRQLWHLTEDAQPHVAGDRAWSRRPSGNLLIQQLIGGGATLQLRGETSPIQGWISRSYGQRAAAPVIEERRSGTQVRYLTLLAPFDTGTGTHRPPVDVSGLRLTTHGFSMTIEVEGHHERLDATATGVRITSIDTPAGDGGG